MKRWWSILFFCSVVFQIEAQSLPAYQIFNARGKKVTYGKMERRLAKKDIILFGEIHNNPIDHWLQLKLIKNLHNQRKLILGLEMLETDNQIQIDRYLAGDLAHIRSDTSLRLWGNYHTDYAPLVEFAKKNKLPVIATNVPTPYAREVYRQGFQALEGLSEEVLALMAPQPMPFDPDLQTYRKIMEMMEHHATPELVMAQALRDATMAHFILRNYIPGSLFLHLNGTYHSEYYEGILWYLKKDAPDLAYATIATTDQVSLKSLLKENRGKADFIIVVDEDMTKTH